MLPWNPTGNNLLEMSYSLGSNFAVVISAMLLYILLLDGKMAWSSRGFQILFGAGFGVFCVISMLVPIQVREGIIIDAKYPLTAISTFFGGPWAGLLTACIAAGFRASLGGVGVFAALPTLFLVWCVGLWFRKVAKTGAPRVRFPQFLGFGMVVWLLQSLGGTVFFFFVPAEQMPSLLIDRSIPSLIVYPPMTVFLGLALDFVESRHKLRNAQLEGELRLRSVFDSSPLPMVILNPENMNVLQGNRIFWDSLGQAFLVANQERLRSAWKNLQDHTGMEFREDCQYRVDRGVRYFSFILGTVELEGETCLLIHVVDRTREVVEEQVRQKLMENLERRNNEVQTLNFALHHDLRTPLVSIQSFLGELRERLQHGDLKRALEDLTRVESASQRLSRLILGISRLNESIHLETSQSECSLTQVVLRVVSQLGIPRECITIEDELLIPWDLQVLEGVLQPILLNSYQFSSPGRSLCIHIAAVPEDKELHLQITDNGIGIPPRYLERVFSLFEKLDPRTTGIGLGLALAKRIVEAHQGKIWLESGGTDQGCTAHISIPRKEAIFP